MKFKDKTFSKTKVANKKRKVDIEIGDSKETGMFYPQFKTKHWDNETNFSIRLIDEDYDSAIQTEKDEKIEWKRGDRTARFYEKETGDEDGGFEFEVELASRPDSNVLEYSIETKGLNFYYQSELTSEEIKRGYSRPENVVGSYAVYHESKKNNYKNAEYQTGKAFHIYRPWAEDTKGVRVWCDLHIDETKGLMTVTIPQDFVDTAQYPVLVDPTFGYTSIGATTVNIPFNSVQLNFAYTASAGDVIESFHFYGRNSGGGNIEMAAYEYNSGTNLAGARLGSVTPVPLTGGIPAWNDSATVSISMSAGNSYAVAFGYDYPAINPSTRFDSSTGDNHSQDTTSTFLPTSWIHASYSPGLYSMYVTYSEVAPINNSNLFHFM